EAAQLVAANRGSYVSKVTRRTALLIVGQDGWPLQKNGRLTNNLRRMQSLQRAGYSITVLTEEELLSRLGMATESARQLYSTARLSRLLQVPGGRLRRWVKAGLIRPVTTVHGVSQFDFSQVISAKALCGLI